MMPLKKALEEECGSIVTSTRMEVPWFQYKRRSVQDKENLASGSAEVNYSLTVNPQLVTHRQPIPLPVDLTRNLQGGYRFTKIDLANYYNQIKLAPECQKRIVLSNNQGVLLQMRLPLRIKSAPGYFQKIMEQLI